MGVRQRARRLIEWQTVCAAITVDVFGAPQAIYRGTRIEGLIDGATTRAGVVQAPISVRVGPKVLEHVSRTLAELRETPAGVLGNSGGFTRVRER